MERKLDLETTRGLVQRALAGDGDAFRSLIEGCEQALRAVVHVRLGAALRRRVTVDDVLQETYLQATRSLDRFQWRDKGSFYRWLGGIAEHVIKRLARFHLEAGKRKVSRERSLDQGPGASGGNPGEPAAVQTSPSGVLRREERFARLEAALGSLTPEQREVVILARIRELPIREIAAQTGRSPDAVSMLLLRAIRTLRKHFENRGRTGGRTGSTLDT